MRVKVADLQLFEDSLQLLLLVFEADASCLPVSLHSTAVHYRVMLSRTCQQDMTRYVMSSCSLTQALAWSSV